MLNVSTNAIVTDTPVYIAINRTTESVIPTNMRYSQFVANRVKSMGSETADILHAAVGICGEAGELLDAVKKHWAYNQELDKENIIEELGDMEFYMCALRMLIGVTQEEVIQANADKLSKRYNSGSYSDEQAASRMDKIATSATTAILNSPSARTGETPEDETAVSDAANPTIEEAAAKFREDFKKKHPGFNG
jgi:NTP pyrophosphatase (non-canonical NTP hydrolase)